MSNRKGKNSRLIGCMLAVLLVVGACAPMTACNGASSEPVPIEQIEQAAQGEKGDKGDPVEQGKSEISPLQGKKVLVIGDSITTDTYPKYSKWVTVLINEGFFPADGTNNDSISSTGFVATNNGASLPTTENSFVDRITAISDPETYDLVIVFGGINDFIQGIPMGESGGDKDTEFKPAVDYFFDYLVKNFVNARIAVLSPLRSANTSRNWVAGVESYYQTEYADYIREVAKKYCLPVLNLTEESGFCPFVDAVKQKWTYSADGLHPSADYQEQFLAPMIKGFLMELYGG